MAAGTTPIFPATPHYAAIQIVTANTARDGTGTLADLFAAGANGSVIDFVKVKAVGSTTLGMIRLYVYDGANSRLVAEIPVPTTAPAGTEPTWEFTWYPPAPPNGDPALVLQSGYHLKASTHVGETFNGHVQGGDY